MKAKPIDTRKKLVVTRVSRGKEWVKWVKEVKRYKLSVIKWISHGDINNIVLHIWKLLSEYIGERRGSNGLFSDDGDPVILSQITKEMDEHEGNTWKISWTEDPGGLQSMGSRRVGHNWATSLSLFTFMHWRRKWQPTPVLLPGESQGWGSLVGCRLWGRTELDTTEVT